MTSDLSEIADGNELIDRWKTSMGLPAKRQVVRRVIGQIVISPGRADIADRVAVKPRLIL